MDSLRQHGSEAEWLEFKCNNAKPEEIGEYISAVANSAALHGRQYGYIVWGVEDKSHDVVGTTFRPSLARQGGEELENWLEHLINPPVHMRFLEFECRGKLVSIVRVGRASGRPVRFKSEEYVRIGSYKKKLKDHPERERELWRLFEGEPFERRVAAQELAASDVLQHIDYPAYFKLLNLPLPENRDAILSRLAEDEMVSHEDDDSWSILNLGAILLATDLNEFRHLSRKAVRVVLYRDESRNETIRETDGHRGYAAGYEPLIGHLTPLLPENEVIEKALRKTVPMYPELAVRELIANALIHQDLSMTGTGPMIEIFPERLEITNPGTPLVDTDRFLDTPPRSRNESLASFMRRAGICEERGSGIDKVVSLTELYQLPAPLFEVVENHTRTVLFAHRPFSQMDKDDRVRACYLHACLQCVSRKQMTNTSLRDRFGIEEQNRAQVSRIIGDTVDAGLVKAYDPESGSRRHARYVPFWA